MKWEHQESKCCCWLLVEKALWKKTKWGKGCCFFVLLLQKPHQHFIVRSSSQMEFFSMFLCIFEYFFFTRGEFTFSVLFIHLWKPNCRVDSSAEGLRPCLDLKKKEAWARLKVLKKLDVWQKVRCTLAHLHISASQVSHGNYFCSSVSILWF